MAAFLDSPLSLLFSLSLILIAYTTTITHSFSIDLIHRDSPNSPFYNPSETHFDRLGHAFRRSIRRAHRLSLASLTRGASFPLETKSRIIANSGEYLLNISLGTPPVEIFGIADTGSDITWTQCKPCSDCYEQNAPLFDPSQSSTYKPVPCNAQSCGLLDSSSCDAGNCQYNIQYGDSSYSQGTLSADTLALGTTSGQAVVLPNTIFGCGGSNRGTFNANGSGIVGLGGGKLSVITQMNSLINGRFSYCLVPLTEDGVSSRLNFGPDAVVSGGGVPSTPLVTKQPGTFYYLTLEAVTVGTQRLTFNLTSGSADEPLTPRNGLRAGGGGRNGGLSARRQQVAEQGNIIIDSGTTLTLLPSELYSQVEAAVEDVLKLERVDPPQKGLQLCYKTGSEEPEVPPITAHFTGADVNLSPLNTFVRLAEDVMCFSFVSSDSQAIYGNLAQMNFLVGYDLNKKTVSFKPADCTKM